ncbi:MAG: hypothetical protein RBS68_02250 [Anaerolineales bacterium]|jgi:hypothetical protein|nr:hypothetical protein [Anaerolineales bacterium]
MFGELPKLFERNFAMAFFLPFVVFLGMIAEIASRFGQGKSLLAAMQSDLIIGTTLLGVISWLGGIFLLVSNRGLYRFLEGYGDWNPLKLISGLQKRKYNKLQEEIEKLDDQFREQKEAFPREQRSKRNHLMRELAERFPDREDLLLPTGFGNILRSFETYPRVMYGIESIDGWSRILAIVPKDYRELIDNAKTQVDFWVNVGFLSILLLLEYIGFAIYTQSLVDWWIVLILLVIAIISPRFAADAAIGWGDYIKASFDIFAPKLREALGFVPPADRDDEERQWVAFSQAIIYRLPERMPDIKSEIDEKPAPKRAKKLSILERIAVSFSDLIRHIKD